MSSLQKFHRRTQPFGPVIPFTTIGSGNNTVGYWLGDVSSNKLIVSPKLNESQQAWGSGGTQRNTLSTTNGLANTNTLAGFGNSITTGHPAAYAAKNLTTGGYNTWYLPAVNELATMYSNKSAVPFSTGNSFVGSYYWSSTENSGNYARAFNMATGGSGGANVDGGYGDGWKKDILYARAVRRTAI